MLRMVDLESRKICSQAEMGETLYIGQETRILLSPL